MKTILLAAFSCTTFFLTAQTLVIDTLAFQDFEVAPAAPTWTFTGPVIYNSGFSAVNATPANSPIGIGGSRAWETTTNSGGLVLDFANTIIPVGYDSTRVRFNLAAMNLTGNTGGPDNLDYVLVAYSTDGGTTYNNRIRVRGATTDNCSWAYSATAIAANYYVPATEQVFQPTSSGLQTTFGYSTVEIVFPGSVSQIAMRITGRSSSSSDTWLIDNLVMTGEYICTPSAATVSPIVCGSYVSPSGNTLSSSGTYLDTIPNSTGCDSVITINLTVNNATSSFLPAAACGSYVLPSGTVVTSGGVYMDTIPNAAGCDSIITVSLNLNNATSSSQTVTACFSYLSPAGNMYTTSGMYMDTVLNTAGCDSVITTTLTIDTVDVSTTMTGATLQANASGATYQWIDCNNGNAVIAGETNQTYMPAANGNYAVIVTQGLCTDTSACVNVTSVNVNASVLNSVSVYPNPFAETFVLENLPVNSVITVTDAQGRSVLTRTSTVTRIEIDLGGEADGIYFVEIKSGDQISHHRVTKQ